MHSQEAADFLAGLDIAVRQYALGWDQVEQLSTHTPKSAYEWFVHSERIAALRDRPFHPSSKAKIGFSAVMSLSTLTEFGKAIQARWVAIKRDMVRQVRRQIGYHGCIVRFAA